MKELKRFKQELWHPQNDVIISTDGYVTTEHDEGAIEALGNIILRLNASAKIWKQNYRNLETKFEDLETKFEDLETKFEDLETKFKNLQRGEKTTT